MFKLITLFLTGALLGAFFIFISAVPTWFLWNWLVPIYFAQYIPAQFVTLPFLHVWGLMWLVACLVGMFRNRVSAKE